VEKKRLILIGMRAGVHSIALLLFILATLPSQSQDFTNTLWESSQVQSGIEHARAELEKANAIARAAITQGTSGLPTTQKIEEAYRLASRPELSGFSSISASQILFGDFRAGFTLPTNELANRNTNIAFRRANNFLVVTSNETLPNLSASNSNIGMSKILQPQIQSTGTTSSLSQQDIDFLRSKGIDPSTAEYVDAGSENQKPTTPSDLKDAVLWMDTFMGMTNAMLPADLITMKKGFLRFRFGGQDYDYSGNFTVALNTPRKHKNAHLGFGSPDKAKFVILENVGGNTFPLPDVTIWEKSSGFIDVEAIGKEWIHSGGYTVSN
jgi:hypothetical protein